MSLYLDASEIKVPLYQSTLVQYFKDKIKQNPQKASEQMIEFQELEPSHTKINMETLQEIAEDDYVKKANTLFKLIKEKINKTEEYSHQLPLKKVGEHFTIIVKVNNEPLTLLLDTGATLTIVNEEKLSSLTVLKEHIVLNTVSGEVYAQLQEADTFSIGDIELKNFQIVSSSFGQKEADGLLGMNFFKAFKFKIDQEKKFLYLNKIKK